MKRISILFSLLFFLPACGLLQSRSSKTTNKGVRDVPFKARTNSTGLRKRVLVLPFLDEKLGRSKTVSDVARKTLVRELLNTRHFVVVKNSDFPQDLSQFLTDENNYDLSQIAKIALGLGISAVVEGKVIEIKAKRVGDQIGIIREVKARVQASVRIRIASAKNGRIIFNDLRKADAEAKTTRVAEYTFSDRFLQEDPKLIRYSVSRAVRGAIRNMIKAIDKIDWEGRVAMISGEKIYINAGRLSGIQIGDIFKITEEGSDVYDPDQGNFLGSAPGRMKGTVEVITYFGQDGCVTIVHSGSGFRENDRVELY